MLRRGIPLILARRPQLASRSKLRRSFSSLPENVTSLPEKAGEAASTAGEAVKEKVLSLWEMYSEALAEYPIRTVSATSGVLCSAGDALAQYFEYRLDIMSPDKESYNWHRTLRMGFWGTLIGGPVLAVWYRGLHAAAEAATVTYEPLVSGRLAWLAERTRVLGWVTDLHKPTEVITASPMKVLMGKVAVDTMLFQAPFLNLYFAVMGALEGLSLSEILEKTRASFHRAWALSFLVWTPVQAINLYFVPVPFQPTVVAGVNVGWTTILSLLNHYHDYGSPRTELEQRRSNPKAAQAAAAAAANEKRAVGSLLSMEHAHAWAADKAAWDLERSQLRTRIAQLLNENKHLRTQLGQMHAASFRADQPPPTNQQSR